jgi:two-component system NtrC family sensor kinase
MPQISVADLEEEVRRLRRELAEVSERQAATDEVLRIIASSPADAQRVFDTIVRNFGTLCSSTFGAIYTFDGEPAPDRSQPRCPPRIAAVPVATLS